MNDHPTSPAVDPPLLTADSRIGTAQISRQIAVQLGLDRRQVKTVMEHLTELVRHHLSLGTDVTVDGLGTFSAVKLPAPLVSFKASRALQASLPTQHDLDDADEA